MAKNTPKGPADSPVEQTPAPAPAAPDLNALVAVLAEAIKAARSEDGAAQALTDIAKQLKAQAPIKKKTFSEVLLEENATTAAKGKLKQEFFLHGNLMTERQLSKDEITMLNTLEPGRYLQNKVTIEVKGPAGAQATYINWPCSTPDKRSDIQSLAGGPGIYSILKKIVEEQTARKDALQKALDTGKAEEVLKHFSEELSR